MNNYWIQVGKWLSHSFQHSLLSHFQVAVERLHTCSNIWRQHQSKGYNHVEKKRDFWAGLHLSKVIGKSLQDKKFNGALSAYLVNICRNIIVFLSFTSMHSDAFQFDVVANYEVHNVNHSFFPEPSKISKISWWIESNLPFFDSIEQFIYN